MFKRKGRELVAKKHAAVHPMLVFLQLLFSPLK